MSRTIFDMGRGISARERDYADRWARAAQVIMGPDTPDELRAEIAELRAENARLRAQLEQALSPRRRPT